MKKNIFTTEKIQKIPKAQAKCPGLLQCFFHIIDNQSWALSVFFIFSIIKNFFLYFLSS